MYPKILTFVAAELLFLLVRSQDILAVSKKQAQRTAMENERCKRGLLRAVLIEAIVFVPASATLLLMITSSLTAKWVAHFGDSTYALLGVASYGFPFAAVKAFVVMTVLTTLRNFASVLPKIGDKPDAGPANPDGTSNAENDRLDPPAPQDEEES